MSETRFWLYMPVRDAELFTVVCLPQNTQTCPLVLMRSPYVDAAENMTEDEICAEVCRENEKWMQNGYGVVQQHCRGRGKSSGHCVPYIYEREDGLALQEWVRTQPFYQGELYLCGGSYTCSVHYATAPFATDIKGAVLRIQDTERYNCNYRNGFYKVGLHGNWYAGMYKRKTLPQKHYVREAFRMLPLSDFSRTVFGEAVESFDEVLRHPSPEDPFWRTHFGGSDAHDAVRHARIPILLETGFYDIYTGGIFDMWNNMDAEAKRQCALVVSPYGHSGKAENEPIAFENGEISQQFGDYAIRWMNAVRGREPFPFEPNKVTYYTLFGGGWRTDDFAPSQKQLVFRLGEDERTYRYNPYAPASFPGGLSTNFGGTEWQDAPGERYDILTCYTPVFERDTWVRGKMTARLSVRSTCEDTCFYARVSLVKPEGDYGLRDDIQQLSNVCACYVPGSEVVVDLTFDEHSFLVHAGERLRVDLSSSAWPHYVPHTNNKGLFSEQTTARIADNTVDCSHSWLNVPVEE